MTGSVETAPRRFDRIESLFAVVLCVALGTTAAGVGTAMAGVMTPVTLGVVAVAVSAGLILLVRPLLDRGTVSRAGWVAAGVAGAIVAALVLVSARYAAEHLLTDRDPGVYVTTARWLATQGALLIDGATGPFAGMGSVDGWSQGLYIGRPDGLVYAQFQHSLPVVMAVGRWLGGDWLLLKSVGLLAGGAAITFWLFVRIVIGSWWALAATAILAIDLVVLHFARDAYSEVLFMVFLFGGFWLLDAARRSESWTPALLSGLVLGATAMTRIDAWLALSGVVVFLFVDTWLAGEAWRTRLTRFGLPVACGLAITTLIGALDLVTTSPDYLRDLGPNVGRLAAFTAFVVLTGLFVSVVFRPWRWLQAAETRRVLAVAGNVVALAIVAGSLYLFVVRPVIGVEHGSAVNAAIEALQAGEGLEVDPLRNFWEQSLRWLSWYLGLPALVLGVAGWAWAWREAFAGRMARLTPFLLSFSIVTAVYLWRPGITPDHLFAMRRFLPVTIPGLVLLGVLAVRATARWVAARRGRAVATVASVAALAAMIIPPGLASVPLFRSTTQVGVYGVTRDLCAVLPSDAAVLVVSARLRAVYAHTVRAFCEVPVAGTEFNLDEVPVAEAAVAWGRVGRTVFVLTDPTTDCTVDPVLNRQIWYPEPERTVARRPEAMLSIPFGLSLYRFDDFRTAGSGAWAACVRAVRS